MVEMTSMAGVRRIMRRITTTTARTSTKTSMAAKTKKEGENEQDCELNMGGQSTVVITSMVDLFPRVQQNLLT